MMRVLVAGGSGAVGALVLPALAARHTVRVLDLRPPAEPVGYVEFVEGSVTDPAALKRAADGQEALVYLAMGRKTGWRDGLEWARTHFTVSVTGLYLTVEACVEAGVRRVVLASSMSVFADYQARDYAAAPQPDATDAYGLSKRLGEQVCAAAVTEHGLSATALRLVGPMSDEEWQGAGVPAVMTSGSDVAAAFLAALDHKRPGFSAYTITGDHERRVLDWSAAERDLGWQPRARRRPDIL
ncbi:NAD-dependent epimerase/dehydratase family protein [Nonomuraea sp. NPDC050790]|uniref:NAD-dependent epimerase/dehydratase family protein n=1 Tax=Nonomuraea sp. NPDC050790 TaxID=3364371 RepID=UPI0037AA9A86